MICIAILTAETTYAAEPVEVRLIRQVHMVGGFFGSGAWVWDVAPTCGRRIKALVPERRLL
jgi:hypothetical protein